MSGAFHAFFVCVGIHSQCDRFVAVAEDLGDAGNIGAVCNCDTGKGVAQLVRMQMLNAVALRKISEVTLGTLRVHRIGGIFLREHIGADCVLGLRPLPLLPEYGGVSERSAWS